MKILLAITTLLASAVVALPGDLPDMNKLMDQSKDVQAFKFCLSWKNAHVEPDFSHESQGEGVLRNIPDKCCDNYRKGVEKHGFPSGFGKIHFLGGNPCTEIKLTDVPSKAWKKIHELAKGG